MQWRGKRTKYWAWCHSVSPGGKRLDSLAFMCTGIFSSHLLNRGILKFMELNVTKRINVYIMQALCFTNTEEGALRTANAYNICGAPWGGISYGIQNWFVSQATNKRARIQDS